jgi:hypothetical protein
LAWHSRRGSRPNPIEEPKRNKRDGCSTHAWLDLAAAEAQSNDRHVPRRSGHAGANETDACHNAERQSHKIVRHEGGGERPAVGRRRLTWIIAKEAARQASNVRPQPLPCSVRLSPIGSPAMTARTSRTAISCHPMWIGIPNHSDLGLFPVIRASARTNARWREVQSRAARAKSFPAIDGGSVRGYFPRWRYGRPGRGRPGLPIALRLDRLLSHCGDGTATWTPTRTAHRRPADEGGGLFLAAQAARAATTRQPRVPRRPLARSSPGA